MRILYADPGLRGLEGHLASSGIAIPPAFRRLGHQVVVLAHCDLVSPLQEATGALPFFRAFTWARWSSDPLAGWLLDFGEAVEVTVADLHQAWRDHGPFDLIYINTARAAQLAAAGRWLKEAFPDKATAPAVAVQLGPDSGLANSGTAGAPIFEVRDPTTVLHRYATRWIGKDVIGRLNLLAVNESVAKEYSFIVDMPVKAITTPEELPAPRHRKKDTEDLIIGFLGHQRLDKGYELLPDLIAQILMRHANVRVIIQHSDPEGFAQDDPARMARTTAKLRELELQERRVELLLKPFVGHEWFRLIDRCDIVVLPYDPPRYASSYSAIFGEALASGAVIVAPARTTMAQDIDRAGGVGTTFVEWTASAVASSVGTAVDHFEDFAGRAYRGGITWRKTHGPDAYASAVVGAAGLNSAGSTARPPSRQSKCSMHGQLLPATFLRHPRLQNGASTKPTGNAFNGVRQRRSWSLLADKAMRRLMRHRSSSILDVAIETSMVPWSYALILDADGGALRSLPFGSRITVEIVIEVASGAVGVAWIDEDYQLASIERTARELPEVHRFSVEAPCEKAHSLMIRNVTPDGRKASFTLRKLDVRVNTPSRPIEG